VWTELLGGESKIDVGRKVKDGICVGVGVEVKASDRSSRDTLRVPTLTARNDRSLRISLGTPSRLALLLVGCHNLVITCTLLVGIVVMVVLLSALPSAVTRLVDILLNLIVGLGTSSLVYVSLSSSVAVAKTTLLTVVRLSVFVVVDAISSSSASSVFCRFVQVDPTSVSPPMSPSLAFCVVVAFLVVACLMLFDDCSTVIHCTSEGRLVSMLLVGVVRCVACVVSELDGLDLELELCHLYGFLLRLWCDAAIVSGGIDRGERWLKCRILNRSVLGRRVPSTIDRVSECVLVGIVKFIVRTTAGVAVERRKMSIEDLVVDAGLPAATMDVVSNINFRIMNDYGCGNV
jgi:hypothetical protein